MYNNENMCHESVERVFGCLLTCPEHNKATAKMVDAAVVPKIEDSKETRNMVNY